MVVRAEVTAAKKEKVEGKTAKKVVNKKEKVGVKAPKKGAGEVDTMVTTKNIVTDWDTAARGAAKTDWPAFLPITTSNLAVSPAAISSPAQLWGVPQPAT